MLKKIYGYWILFIWAISYLSIFPLYVILILLKQYKIVHWLNNKYWCHSILILTGIPLRTIGRKNLKKSQPYVFAANHTSFYDIVTTFASLQRPFTIVGKSSLAKIPAFGFMYSRLYTILDRSSRIARVKTMKKCMEAIDDKKSVVIYPEGTIPNVEDHPHMIRFNDGPFRIAIEKQVPLVPVTFAHNWIIMPDSGKHGAKWHKAVTVIHEPIETLGMTVDDVGTLKEKTYKIIDLELKKRNNL